MSVHKGRLWICSSKSDCSANWKNRLEVEWHTGATMAGGQWSVGGTEGVLVVLLVVLELLVWY